jgi:hypothetical protein
MRKYYVEIQVNYCGEIEANSEAEAEKLAWSSYYGDNATLEYDSVEDIRVEELPHCEECDNPEDECECEDEEEVEEDNE